VSPNRIVSGSWNNLERMARSTRYARFGPMLRCERVLLGLTIRELAAKTGTSHVTITRLEGIIGCSVRAQIAFQIATVLGLDPDDAFGPKPAQPGRIGERYEDVTPASRRYAGSHMRESADAWGEYLARVGDTEVFDWPEKLSAQRAAKRFTALLGFGLTPTRLANLARAGQLRYEVVSGPGLGRHGEGYRFDEAELWKDLQALPRCAEDGCERPALCSSGGCPTHSRAIQMRGHSRPREAVERTAAAKRGTKRPDASTRMSALHGDARAAYETALAVDPDFIGVTEVAAMYGVTPHAVISDLMPRGRARVVRRAAVGIEGDRPIFSRKETEHLLRSWLRSSDVRARRWLDPDVAISHARADGRLAVLAAEHGVSMEEAEALARARVWTRRRKLLPKRAGAKPTNLPKRWAKRAESVRVELEEARRCDLDLGLANDGPVSDYAVAAQVAHDDCSENPDDWLDQRVVGPDGSWRLNPSFRKSAANRILTALARHDKSLQNGYTESVHG
jgi:transcriptional regulator with XRE-family HTH domain